MEQTKSRHSVESEALQNVLNYLQERPFKEVSALIDGIMKSVQQVQTSESLPSFENELQVSDLVAESEAAGPEQEKANE